MIYNAQALLSSLPKNVNEFGMVGCQLGDDVSESLIRFIASSINLKMICVEDNLFSPLDEGPDCLSREKAGWLRDSSLIVFHIQTDSK